MATAALWDQTSSKTRIMTTLKELIRQVAEENKSADPRELATHVAASAPGHQLRNLLAEAIVDDCRQHLMTQRNNALDGVRRTNYSHRLAGQRDWYANLLAARVGFANGDWKALGSCTIDDLTMLIEEHETNIARIQGRINQYELLANLMRQHNATHVRELPREIIESGFAA